MLIDGGEVYVQWSGDSNTSNNSYTFLQDYQIHIKGVDPEGKRIWVELSRGGISLKDAIVTENSQFVYSQNNSTEILNLTVKTIYAGADGVLVRFSPVYQYLDPGFPKPEISDKPLNNSSVNNFSSPSNPETQAEGFDTPFFFLVLGTMLIFMSFFAKKLRKK
ncbi:MAG TPA: S-layer protein domain-containing protein [Methanosarcina sp.]|nr:S-layer protein domain-containing protein [Methanosarcina sp.]